MKNRMILIFALILITVRTTAAEIIDKKRVYNPQLNECVKAFDVEGEQNNQSGCELNRRAMLEVEELFLTWMTGENSPSYLREFDTSLFHYQFIENKALGKCKTAVIVVIPDAAIRDNFYSELGGGLEIPGTRCIGSHCTWINDGEIFSFIVDRELKSISEFRNWRFEQEDFHVNPEMAYYSQLIINYKCNPEILPNTKLIHCVDNEFRAEIPVEENYPILLPKGRISTFAFYVDDQVKGVLCFDLSAISKGCPMNFESTVYLKDRYGYERILYAQPKCEGIYTVELMEKEKFEEVTSIKWETLAAYNDEMALN